MLVPRITSLGASTVAVLALAASAAATPLVPQDIYEPNDTCATAALIPLGTITNPTIGPDDDFFLVMVAANSDITVEAVDSLGVHIDVELFEWGCMTSLASSTGASLEYFDCGGNERDLIVQVKAGAYLNEAYTLTVLSVEVEDDGIEDNDDCNSGSLVSIASFTTPGLVVTGCDEDYFVARVQGSGVEIQVDLLFAHADGDIDLELWDLGCNTLLASSTSTTDNEFVRYTNTTNPSMAEAVVIRAFIKNGEGHNTYALTACFANVNSSGPSIGIQSCEGQTNETGRPATLCAIGSDVAINNGVKFYVVDLPVGSAGYFISSPLYSFTANPAGSQGNLCLGTPGRYSFDVQFTGSGSAVFYEPDLTTTPVAGGSFAPVVAGDTRYWQYWYRDSVMGTAVSNFSSTIRIDFL